MPYQGGGIQAADSAGQDTPVLQVIGCKPQLAHCGNGFVSALVVAKGNAAQDTSTSASAADVAASWYILGPTKVALEITETGEDVPEELERVTGKENVNHRDLGEFDFSAAPPHSLSAVVSMRRRTGWQLRGPRGTQALPLGSPSGFEGPGVPC